MDPEDIEHFRLTLEAMRREILSEGDIEVATEEGAGDRTDDDSRPLDEMLKIIASRRNKVRTGSLKQINAALRRISESPDDFGYCLDCDDPMPRARLDLMPYVELCVRCQSAREDPRGGPRKHLTDFDH